MRMTRYRVGTFLALLLVACPTLVDSQRTMVSLGKKLKLFGKKSEVQTTADLMEAGECFTDRFGIWIYTAVVALVVAIILGLWQRTTKTAELIVEDADQIDAEHRKDTSVDVAFEDIRMELVLSKKKNGPRVLLDGSIRARARPGRMLAIMGPSGSGKSSLLHALAGKVKYSSKLNLYGKRYVNGHLVSGDSKLPAAVIEQDVNFFPHMTVKETLDFRVELKLGSQLSRKQRDLLVRDLLEQLNLSQAADTIVGDTKIRGISGGERKRLSIACEMVSSPGLILLDEPTSGLDSYQAMQVIETLRALADAGKTIVAVIHQPSQQAFATFDDLLLLSEGKQMYYGTVQDARSYMESMGYAAPQEMGTAEHVLDCISRVTVGGDIEARSVERLDKLAQAAKEAKVDLGLENKADKKKLQRFVSDLRRGPRANILRQFKLLLQRSVHEAFRGKTAIIIKIVQQVTLGLIYGGIYHLGNNQASIQDRVGLLSLVAIGTTNLAMAGTIRSFPREKAIVSSEMATKLYSVFPYFVAKAISEIPLIGVFTGVFGSILYPLTGLQPKKFRTFLGLTSLHSIASEATGLLVGAISANSDIALALLPPVIVLNIIFDGKNISEENTPRLLRWLPKVGLIRWGFEGLALNEFQGLEFDTSGPRRGPVAKTGEEALARFGLMGKSVHHVVQAQTRIIAACWFLSYIGLSLTKQKFLVMRPSPSKVVANNE